jgi:hypothetical protein
VAVGASAGRVESVVWGVGRDGGRAERSADGGERSDGFGNRSAAVCWGLVAFAFALLSCFSAPASCLLYGRPALADGCGCLVSQGTIAREMFSGMGRMRIKAVTDSVMDTATQLCLFLAR